MPDDLPVFNLDPNAPLAADEALIKDCLDRIRKAEAAAASTVAVLHWRMGYCYRSVIQGAKWKLGPYKSGAQWATKVFGKSASLIYAAAAVTRAYEEAVAARGDFNVLLRFLVFANVSGLSPLPKDPWETPIPVPGPKGTVGTKKLADCSVREVNAAIAKIKRPVSKPLSPETSERLSRFRAALAGVLPEGQPFPVVVEETKGVVRWGLAKMPQESFDKVIPALATAWAPVPALPDRTLERVQEMTVRGLEAASKIGEDVAGDPAKRAALVAKLNEGLGLLRKIAGP